MPLGLNLNNKDKIIKKISVFIIFKILTVGFMRIYLNKKKLNYWVYTPLVI